MYEKGQIIRIKRPFRQVCDDSVLEDTCCQIEHKNKNLIGEIVEKSKQLDDGFYELFVLLDVCNELHVITVLPEDVELNVIRTLKHIKNEDRRFKT